MSVLFSFLVPMKLILMFVTWSAALLISYAFRTWGGLHPNPFEVRPLVLLLLLFGPAFLIGLWILVFGSPVDDDEKLTFGDE